MTALVTPLSLGDLDTPCGQWLAVRVGFILRWVRQCSLLIWHHRWPQGAACYPPALVWALPEGEFQPGLLPPCLSPPLLAEGE